MALHDENENNVEIGNEMVPKEYVKYYNGIPYDSRTTLPPSNNQNQVNNQNQNTWNTQSACSLPVNNSITTWGTQGKYDSPFVGMTNPQHAQPMSNSHVDSNNVPTIPTIVMTWTTSNGVVMYRDDRYNIWSGNHKSMADALQSNIEEKEKLIKHCKEQAHRMEQFTTEQPVDIKKLEEVDSNDPYLEVRVCDGTPIEIPNQRMYSNNTMQNILDAISGITAKVAKKIKAASADKIETLEEQVDTCKEKASTNDELEQRIIQHKQVNTLQLSEIERLTDDIAKKDKEVVTINNELNVTNRTLRKKTNDLEKELVNSNQVTIKVTELKEEIESLKEENASYEEEITTHNEVPVQPTPNVEYNKVTNHNNFDINIIVILSFIPKLVYKAICGFFGGIKDACQGNVHTVPMTA